MKTAVEQLEKQILDNWMGILTGKVNIGDFFEQAKEMEKEQKGYSEEDVRLAYFQGEKDSYVKGGQTKKMEDEFIESLKQKKTRTMPPKEKAQELVDKFIEFTQDWDARDGYINDEFRAKECALIAVDEIIRIETHHVHHKWVEYWEQVKHELNKSE
jgi:hypothetical protein